jgi:hypothetical protein
MAATSGLTESRIRTRGGRDRAVCPGCRKPRVTRAEPTLTASDLPLGMCRVVCGACEWAAVVSTRGWQDAVAAMVPQIDPPARTVPREPVVCYPAEPMATEPEPVPPPTPVRSRQPGERVRVQIRWLDYTATIQAVADGRALLVFRRPVPVTPDGQYGRWMWVALERLQDAAG